MRSYGFLIGQSAGLRAVAVPSDNSRSLHRRRLDDSLVDTFQRAVASNKLDAAADLLAILEKWHDRRKFKYGRERRIGDADLIAMRADLGRLTALRTS
jgi:hypothetical protein